MNRIHTPDLWQVLVIESEEYGKSFKVLGSWYGGFVGSNSWKLSSGTESITFDGQYYTLPQASGSTYVLYKDAVGMSGFTHSIYAGFLKDAEANGFSLKIASIEDVMEYFSV